MSEPAAILELAVLGPLRASRAGATVPLGGVKPRAVLATLAVRAERVVSVAGMADAVWNDDPPPTSASILQVYVSGLRRALTDAGGVAVIETVSPGYRLRLGAEQLDLGRFRLARAEGVAATRAQRPEDASRAFATALAEWSGPVLEDLRGLRFADELATSLEEERLVVLQGRIEADLDCGRHGELIAELTALTRDHPFREPLWALLISALYGCGRQADALAALRRVRTVLREELGIDPSPSLRELERDILAQRELPKPTRPQPLAPLSDRTVQEQDGPWHTGRLSDQHGRSVLLGAVGLRIGREPGCDLVVDDPRASRRHAVITHVPDGFLLTDLTSTNGTQVNGHRLSSSTLLVEGDEIAIGQFRFVFSMVAEAGAE